MHSHPSCEVIWENFNFFTISGSDLATHSQVLHNSDLTCESLPYAFAHFASNLWVARESLTRKMHEKSVLRAWTIVSQKLCPLAPRDSLSPKLEISSKLNLFLLDFSSKTTLRYFLKLLLFQFLSFSSGMLKTEGWVHFQWGLGKTYFVQTFFNFFDWA